MADARSGNPGRLSDTATPARGVRAEGERQALRPTKAEPKKAATTTGWSAKAAKAQTLAERHSLAEQPFEEGAPRKSKKVLNLAGSAAPPPEHALTGADQRYGDGYIRSNRFYYNVSNGDLPEEKGPRRELAVASAEANDAKMVALVLKHPALIDRAARELEHWGVEALLHGLSLTAVAAAVGKRAYRR